MTDHAYNDAVEAAMRQAISDRILEQERAALGLPAHTPTEPQGTLTLAMINRMVARVDAIEAPMPATVLEGARLIAMHHGHPMGQIEAHATVSMARCTDVECSCFVMQTQGGEMALGVGHQVDCPYRTPLVEWGTPR